MGGFILSVFFNSYAVQAFGPETILWTAYKNPLGNYEIPFLICMGWAFFFTMVMMIVMSLAGPKIDPKGLELDTAMFKVAPSTLALIVVTLLCVAGLYITFL